MLQKLSDAELEIMKIIWENPEKTTLFSCLMEQLAAQRICAPDFGDSVPDGADPAFYR